MGAKTIRIIKFSIIIIVLVSLFIIGCINTSQDNRSRTHYLLESLDWEYCVQCDIDELIELWGVRTYELRKTIEDYYINDILIFEQYAQRRLILDFDILMLKTLIEDKIEQKTKIQIIEIKLYHSFEI